MPRPTFLAAPVLAAAYRVEGGPRLKHAASPGPVRVGRLSREAGEGICDRRLSLADRATWEHESWINCPRCLQILARIKRVDPDRPPDGETDA